MLRFYWQIAIGHFLPAGSRTATITNPSVIAFLAFVFIKLSSFPIALNWTRCLTDSAMWRRNSLSLSSKLANHKSNPSVLLLLRSSLKSHHHGLVARSSSTSPESTSTADPVIWAQPGPEIRHIGPRATSASIFDFPSLAAASAFKAKEVAYLAKHYGRCYWELSKARLRLSILFIETLLYLSMRICLFSMDSFMVQL